MKVLKERENKSSNNAYTKKSFLPNLSGIILQGDIFGLLLLIVIKDVFLSLVSFPNKSKNLMDRTAVHIVLGRKGSRGLPSFLVVLSVFSCSDSTGKSFTGYVFIPPSLSFS